MGKSNFTFTAGCGCGTAGSGYVDVDKDKRGKKRDAREGENREDRPRSLLTGSLCELTRLHSFLGNYMKCETARWAEQYNRTIEP